MLGYWYEKDFSTAGIKAENVANDELNLKKLQAGRVDIIPAEELVGRVLIKKLFPGEQDKFVTLTKPMMFSSLHLMFSKKNPDTEKNIKSFNEGLKKIKANGKYKAIMSKYGITDIL